MNLHSALFVHRVRESDKGFDIEGLWVSLWIYELLEYYVEGGLRVFGVEVVQEGLPVMDNCG